MISLLKSVVDFLMSIGGIIVHTIESLVNLFLHIPTYVSFLSVSISYLPTVILPFAIASISIYVVFIIINRG